MTMDPGARPPSMDRLLESPAGRALEARHGRERAKTFLREAAARWRGSPSGPAEATILADATARLGARLPAGPARVVNATGVLLHTNLGRSARPLGRRGRRTRRVLAPSSTSPRAGADRGEHVTPLLLELFAPGRPAWALAVGNAAAAPPSRWTPSRTAGPVAVSRGELVAIGGGLRVPSILARSGATLLEVGTTNRTTPDDYREALAAGAGAVLKVRPSNYGSSASPRRSPSRTSPPRPRARRSAGLRRRRGNAPAVRGVRPRGQPVPLDALDAGADLVLLGRQGARRPQARIPPQARDRRARREEPARAGACGRTSSSSARSPRRSTSTSRAGAAVPFFRMVAEPLDALFRRAEALAAKARAAGYDAEAVASTAIAGGGAGAESTLPSAAVALRRGDAGAGALAAALRSGQPPVVARIEDGRVLLDLRSVAPEEDEELVAALLRAATFS